MKKSVFITGAAGFIGRNTVQEFVEQGWYVYALIHKSESPKLEQLEKEGSITIMQGDITNFKSLKSALLKCKQKTDVIVHCGGRASDVGWQREFRKANFESVQHIVKLVKDMDIEKLVFISTTDVYGLKDFNGETEDELSFVKNPINPYPKFKIEAEKWIRQELPPEKFSIIRPAAVYGKDDTTITKRTVDFLKVSPFIIHFGKWRGKNRWPLAHIDNVSNAIYLASIMPEAEGKANNVLDNKHTTIDEFYQFIANECFPDKKFKQIYLPMWLGVILGTVITLISNILNLKEPFTDPSLYALNSISKNLDFSCDRLNGLKESYKIRTN